MDPTKTDLARKFNDWYKSQFEGKTQSYMDGISPNPWGYLSYIILPKNNDAKNRSTGEYQIVTDKIIIKISGEVNDNSETISYSGRVCDKDNNKSCIDIEFTENNKWKYENGEIYYFNEKGPINNREAVFTPWKDIVAEVSNGIDGVLPSNKRKRDMDDEVKPIEKKFTRSGALYGGNGERKSRKSRKSRKNKKQKNRKTNRR